ncbi:3'-5' exonuclease [Clostridium sp.]
MTVHKSKGLEYECIFFVGLEDGAFWIAFQFIQYYT